MKSQVKFTGGDDFLNKSQGINAIYLGICAMVCLVNTMVFPVVMYGCESWTIKKA